jgi:hypothetical protein
MFLVFFVWRLGLPLLYSLFGLLDLTHVNDYHSN